MMTGEIELKATPRARPLASGTGREVASLVAEAHETGVEAVVPGLGSREAFERVLTYCAEQRCVDDRATCAGCRLRTQADGITTLDGFIARQAEVRVAQSGARLTGEGVGQVEVDSLDWLARHWSGEEYWFWARRVLRKLRYGIRQADELFEDVGSAEAGPAVLLMEPQIPENIGMVARAMGNFGLAGLRVVQPRDGWPNEKARAVASGAAAIIDDAKLYDGLEDAVGDLNWVVATTARQRDMRKPVMTPAEAVQELHNRISRGERCGILFGRERHGLQTSEVALADAIVMIPINNKFASLNLAQAVLLLGYEWLKVAGGGSLGRVTSYERPVESGLHLGNDRPATKQELVGFFEHLENELERLGFFHPEGRRHVVVRNLRTMFTRLAPTEQEVRTLRGIVATLARGKGKARKAPE
ncbi:MAG: RNA methyltransferase [Hyphomicrobiaceae bacterium]|nr:RNA methyltransferase [Hyphomicrobiaceae bacterium]